MSVSASSGKTTISGNVNVNVTSQLPGPGLNQTVYTIANGKSGTSITAGTGNTLRTVTASSYFYLTSISIGWAAGNQQGRFEIRDGGSGGVIKLNGTAYGDTLGGSAQVYTQTFPTPIRFSTDIWLDVNATQAVLWSVQGYEVAQ